MTSREDLHALIDRLAPESWDDAALWLHEHAREPEASGELAVSEVDGLPLPASLGVGQGPGDLGRKADQYLAEGFGR